jgi:hypothetical protein
VEKEREAIMANIWTIGKVVAEVVYGQTKMEFSSSIEAYAIKAMPPTFQGTDERERWLLEVTRYDNQRFSIIIAYDIYQPETVLPRIESAVAKLEQTMKKQPVIPTRLPR